VCPEILRLGPLVLHGYGTMVALGLVVSWLLLTREARRRGLDVLADKFGELVGWMLLSGFVGGKLYYVWSSPDEFREIVARGSVREILGKGFVFYGSLLTCIPTFWIWAKKRGLPILRSLDTIIFAAPVMLGLGRVGCFLSGCCFGHRADLPWAVDYPEGHATFGTRVHPAPLYETIGCAVVFVVLWFVVRPRAARPGVVVAAYLVLYGIERFVVEFFRGDAARGFLFGGESLKAGDPPSGLAFSQAVSIPLVIGAATWLYVALKRKAPVETSTRAERRRAR
jgi:phosphatidylglycerol---prolipoprotein diacylglyceryl transferase